MELTMIGQLQVGDVPEEGTLKRDLGSVIVRYKQGHKTIGTIDLLNVVAATGIHKYQVDRWISDRPGATTSIVLTFADNVELILWQHTDWNMDRRRV